MIQTAYQPRTNFPRRVEIIKSRLLCIRAAKMVLTGILDMSRNPYRQNTIAKIFDNQVADVGLNDTEILLIAKIVKAIFIENIHSHYVTLSLDSPEKISYAKACHKHDYTHRVRTKLGRYIQRNVELTSVDSTNCNIDKVISCLQSAFWASIKQIKNDNSVIEISDGINAIYCNENFPRSCMTDEPYTEWYDELKECSCLVYSNISNKDYARALIWTLNDGKRIVDRIYSRTDISHAAILDYANAKGYFVRSHHKLSDENDCLEFTRKTVDCAGCETIETIDQANLQLFSPEQNAYPYLDSFRFVESFSHEDRVVYLTLNKTSDSTHLLTSTSGGVEEITVNCYRCGGSTDSDYSSTINDHTYCDECTFLCDYCEEVTSLDDHEVLINYISSRGYHDHASCCTHCYDVNSFCCTDCGEMFDNDLGLVDAKCDSYCETCWNKLEAIKD